MVCFIAGSATDAIELLDFFKNIFHTNGKSIGAFNNGTIIADALNYYGLLYAGLWGNNHNVSDRARKEFDSVMPIHVKQLESDTMEVRVASGENIALIFEILGIGRKRNPSEEWEQLQDVNEVKMILLLLFISYHYYKSIRLLTYFHILYRMKHLK
jgi:hypothetical protein